MLDYPYEIINTEVAGHLVESAIANSMEKFSFWRTPQHEVDIIVEINNKIIPIEVKYKVHIDKKDIKGIIKFMEEFKVKKGFVITKEMLRQEIMGDKELIFIPAWLFLLTKYS